VSRKSRKKKRRKGARAYAMYTECLICGKRLKSVSHAHLRTHGTTVAEYKEEFDVGFVMSDYLRRQCSVTHSKRGHASKYEPLTKQQMLQNMREMWNRRSRGKEEQRKKELLANMARGALGSLGDAAEAAGIRFVPLKDRSPKTVARDLRAWCRKHGPLSFPKLKDTDPGLEVAVRNKFGGIAKAGKALGLPYEYVRDLEGWSKAEVRRRIRARKKKGLSLVGDRVCVGEHRLYCAARKWFGSWGRALKASGIDPKEIRMRSVRVREEELGQRLREWCEKHGPLHRATLKRTDRRLSEAAWRRFGSIEKTARRLCLPYRYDVTHWDKALVRKRLRERIRKKLSMQPNRVRADDLKLYEAASRVYGSYATALKDAGVDCENAYLLVKRTPEGVKRQLRAWCRRHGTLDRIRLKATDHALLSAATKRFGSLEKAAAAAGVPFRRRVQRWTKERVLKEVKARARSGKGLSDTCVSRENLRLHAAAYRHWGSGGSVVEAAGFDYDEIVRTARSEGGRRSRARRRKK
jgi:molybdenum-dependent DNA-binding transcriptional regulator ModE